MRFIGVVLGFLVSGSSLAQEYVIQRVEASDFRTFTVEEILANLGDNVRDLPYLRCNGVDEFDLFADPLHSNINGDSLKVKAYKSDTILTYRRGRYYAADGSEVKSPEDVFFRLFAEAMEKLETLPSAARLIRLLESSSYPLTVTFGNSMFLPLIETPVRAIGMKLASAIVFLNTHRTHAGGPVVNQIGIGGQIRWSPKNSSKFIEEDGVSRSVPSEVVLAHEMFHAFDAIRGKLDMGIVRGEDHEAQTVTEYRGVFFENLVRQELGMKLRKYYGHDPYLPPGKDLMTGPDLLDDQGNPILIPAPCTI